jgi:hypothetical protein
MSCVSKGSTNKTSLLKWQDEMKETAANVDREMQGIKKIWWWWESKEKTEVRGSSISTAQLYQDWKHPRRHSSRVRCIPIGIKRRARHSLLQFLHYLMQQKKTTASSSSSPPKMWVSGRHRNSIQWRWHSNDSIKWKEGGRSASLKDKGFK